MKEAKLLLRDRVEVRQLEEGLQGSWFAGMIVRVSKSCRFVKYNELLSESDHSKLIESIPVSEAIDGIQKRHHFQPTYRGRIRPLFSHQSGALKSELNFGVCVDVFIEDAWWEGVIFDFDCESNERLIYFPDGNDECMFSVNNLRLSREWDEFLDDWKDRGVWALVELALTIKINDLPFFIKTVWANLRIEFEFVKSVLEWTCGVRSFWDNCFQRVVYKIMIESPYYFPECVVPKKRKVVISENVDFDACKRDKQMMLRRSTRSQLKMSEHFEFRQRKVRHDLFPATKIQHPVISSKLTGKGGSKNLLLNNSKTRPPNKEKMDSCDASRELDGACIDQCRHSLSLDKSGEIARLKENMFYPSKHKRKREYPLYHPMDTVCFVCHSGEDLISCDHCFSSYHLSCIKEIPDDRWFCVSCRCGLCGLRDSNGDSHLFSNACEQCGHQYHVDCLNKAGHFFPTYDPLSMFCSVKCSEIYGHLQRLLGTSNPTSMKGITWTLMRRMMKYCSLQNEVKGDIRRNLSLALDVLSKCFQPLIDSHTNSNILANVVRSSWSKWKRLDFHRFYVMALQSGEEIVCVATVRIHGHKVAEMPLIATNFQYRRQGMCRLLLQELEKILNDMGVERLTLPAVGQLKETWETSFGFKEMSPSQRLELLEYPLLGFKGTTMFQKFLPKYMEIRKTRGAHQTTKNSKSGHSQEGVILGNKKRRLCRTRGKENMEKNK